MAQDKNTAAQEAARKALEAAQANKEKKKIEHTYTQVGQQSASKEELLAATRKNALPYRIGAIILWILAIVCEVLAILVFVHKIEFSFTVENPGYTIAWIALLVLDLIFVIIGSQLWKKANHLDPASAKNKLRFWLHNNLGVIVAIIAFAPFIIVVLLDKNADVADDILVKAVEDHRCRRGCGSACHRRPDQRGLEPHLTGRDAGKRKHRHRVLDSERDRVPRI